MKSGRAFRSNCWEWSGLELVAEELLLGSGISFQLLYSLGEGISHFWLIMYNLRISDLICSLITAGERTTLVFKYDTKHIVQKFCLPSAYVKYITSHTTHPPLEYILLLKSLLLPFIFKSSFSLFPCLQVFLFTRSIPAILIIAMKQTVPKLAT